MAKKELSLILRAKNELQVGLAKAKATLGQFGSSVMGVGKMIGGAFLAAGTAVVGFAAKALSAYAESETATRSLTSAFATFGEETTGNVAKVQALTDAIKEETGASGTALTARAAKLKMLGVETSQLDAALRSTVALTNAGMEEEAATRATAQALLGNFSALEKYIPALKSATSAEQKAAMVRDFMARGYTAQKAQLNTLAGQWSLLKERVGDAWEEIGRAIASDTTIQSGLAVAGSAVKSFGETVAEWTKAGGVINFKATMLGTLAEISYRFQLLGMAGNLAMNSLLDFTLITKFGRIIGATVNSVVESFKVMGAWGEAVWNKITNPTQPFQSPDMSVLKASFSAVNDELWRPIQQNTSETYEQMLQLGREHAARMDEISQQQLVALEANNARQLESTRATTQASVAANQVAADQVWQTAATLGENLKATTEAREETEASTLDSITAMHDAAASDVASYWARSAQSIAATTAAAGAVDTGEAKVGNTGKLGWTGITGSIASMVPGAGSMSAAIGGASLPSVSRAEEYLNASSERLAVMIPILQDIRDDLRSNLRLG